SRNYLGYLLLAVSITFKPQLGVIIPFLLLVRSHDYIMQYRVHAVDAGRTAARWAREMLTGGAIGIGIVTAAGFPFKVGLFKLQYPNTYGDRLRVALDTYDGISYGALSVWTIPLGIKPPPSISSSFGWFTYQQWSLALLAL